MLTALSLTLRDLRRAPTAWTVVAVGTSTPGTAVWLAGTTTTRTAAATVSASASPFEFPVKKRNQKKSKAGLRVREQGSPQKGLPAERTSKPAERDN